MGRAAGKYRSRRRNGRRVIGMRLFPVLPPPPRDNSPPTGRAAAPRDLPRVGGW
jgi:hypothetical protein